MRAMFVAVASTVALVAACSKAEPSPAASSSGATATTTAAAKAAAPATPVQPAAAEMVEIDLSSADPAWKGWVVQGPKDTKVLADGDHGARVAANGLAAFDLSFAQGKAHLADVKSGVEAGSKAGGLEVKFTTDTADKIARGARATRTHTRGSPPTFFACFRLRRGDRRQYC